MVFHPGKIYYIEWYDHWSSKDGGWTSYQDQLEPIIIQSIGFCMASNEIIIRLAGHKNMDSTDFSGEANIMISSIKDAWELTNI